MDNHRGKHDGLVGLLITLFIFLTPWLVFLGGSAALTAVTALGAIGGQGLCRVIPERVILWISAGAFVVLGILMGVGVL